MKLAMITYDNRHLKTELLVNNFVLRGMASIDIFALPFVARPGREVLFQHRPSMTDGAHPSDVAAYYKLSYQQINQVDDIEGQYDYVIIAGAGLLPASFVDRYRVVNAHPGLIPLVRGLDAFKWAIYHHLPLGNSLHYIDAEVDAGEHIKSVATPVYQTDTLASLARRHFDLEISMMSNFLEYVGNNEPTLVTDVGEANRRMKQVLEQELLAKFAAYKATFAVK